MHISTRIGVEENLASGKKTFTAFGIFADNGKQLAERLISPSTKKMAEIIAKAINECQSQQDDEIEIARAYSNTRLKNGILQRSATEQEIIEIYRHLSPLITS